MKEKVKVKSKKGTDKQIVEGSDCHPWMQYHFRLFQPVSMIKPKKMESTLWDLGPRISISKAHYIESNVRQC